MLNDVVLAALVIRFCGSDAYERHIAFMRVSILRNPQYELFHPQTWP